MTGLSPPYRGAHASSARELLSRLTVLAILTLFATACAPTTAPARGEAPASTSQAPAATSPAARSGAASSTEPIAAQAQPSQSALTAKPAPLSPPVSLIIGTQGNAGEIGIYAGIELGYFQEEGLEINPQYFRTGPEALPALAAGHIDIGNGGVGASFFNAPARGIPLKMVADLQFISPTYRGTVWAVRSELIDSGQVKEAKDFKGLTVGLGSLGTASDIDLDKILDAGGLTRADIEIKTLPYTDMVAAFANKSIDFAYVFEPIRTTILEQRTAKEWKTSGEIYPNHESSVVFYGPTMEQKREAGRRFMVGYLRGVRWAREMYEKRDSQVYELTARWATIKDPELLRKLVPPEANPDGSVYRGSLENDLAYYVGQNLVDQPPDLEQVIDNTYVEYAISRLGKYKPGCGPSPCP